MSRRTSLLLGLTLVALGVSCSNVPAPPPDTRAADLQAVKEVEAAWSKDAGAKDADKYVSYFAEDGTALYPGTPILNGKTAIKAAMLPVLADPNFALTFQPMLLKASKGGDMVYALGAYTQTMTNPKTKKPMQDTGKYLTIYTKQADGSWKAVADTFNSDLPM